MNPYLLIVLRLTCHFQTRSDEMKKKPADWFFWNLTYQNVGQLHVVSRYERIFMLKLMHLPACFIKNNYDIYGLQFLVNSSWTKCNQIKSKQACNLWQEKHLLFSIIWWKKHIGKYKMYSCSWNSLPGNLIEIMNGKYPSVQQHNMYYREMFWNRTQKTIKFSFNNFQQKREKNGKTNKCFGFVPHSH